MSYTTQEIVTLNESAPLTFERAVAIALEIGKSHRSVIAKAKSLGIEYIPKAKAAAKPSNGPTKAEILGGIRAQLAMPAREGDLTKAELVTILGAIS